MAQPPVVSWLACPRNAASSNLSWSLLPEFAKFGKDDAASSKAACVKKFAPEQAALLMFGKNASKSACVNHSPMPLPGGPGDDVGMGEGTGVGEGMGTGDGIGTGEGAPLHPVAFQVDLSLQ